MERHVKSWMRTPLRVYPVIVPALMATWFIPIPLPRSLPEKASVTMATLLTNNKAAPMPWTSLKARSASAVGERPEKGAEGEDCEAHVVEPDPSMHVGPTTNPDKENRDHQPVDCDNPDTNHKVGFQIRHDLWKPYHHDAGVKGRHENSDGSNGQNNPLVLQEKPTPQQAVFFRENQKNWDINSG